LPSPFHRYLKEIWRLRATCPGLPENLVVVEQVDSTNRLARRIASEYEEEGQSVRPLLVLAMEQVGGRGRRGRSWSSPHGKGVYATRVVAVDDPQVLQTLPLLVGVGLARVLSRVLPGVCRLKWPNDLLMVGASPAGHNGSERRKIGGILIEAILRPGEGGVALVGFGVNVGHEPGDMPEGATSYHLEGGTGRSLEQLTCDLMAGVEEELTHLGDGDYAVARYREHSIHREGERIVCRVGDETLEGTFAGFDELGHLRLLSQGKEQRISAGEVIEE
jgi:BirA family biotin operon repressor/biotin-[acetyl-CoA-carboxylase] ligase